MTKQFQNYINGEFVPSQGNKFFENKNPSHKDEILGEFPKSDISDVDAAVSAAKQAQPEWEKVTSPQRGKILFKIAELMEQKKDEIAKAIVKEMAKPLGSAQGDVQSGIDLCRYMAGEGRRLFGQTTSSELAERTAQTRRVPVGVCALITPWNAPMAAIAWKVFPAIIAGNTVILKPSKDTPETANFLAEILHEAELPKGVFNLVHGTGSEVGDPLVQHKDVDLVSFTGSTEVGIRINEICASRLASVSLEMGGKNAVLVLDDADVDTAVDAVVSGAFSLAGQRCSSTSRVIVQDSVYTEFMDKLTSKTKSLKVGPAEGEGVDVIPVINEQQYKDISGAIESAKTAGIECVVGGEALSGGAYDEGYYISPTIFVDVPQSSALWRKEIFGPVLAVARCSSFEQGIDMVNDSDFGLISSVFTSDVTKAQKAMDMVQTGVCYINAPTFGSEVHLPFGGLKLSGNGHREPGAGSIDVFTEWQTVYIDYSGEVQNSQTVTKK